MDHRLHFEMSCFTFSEGNWPDWLCLILWISVRFLISIQCPHSLVPPFLSAVQHWTYLWLVWGLVEYLLDRYRQQPFMPWLIISWTGFTTWINSVNELTDGLLNWWNLSCYEIWDKNFKKLVEFRTLISI